MVSVCHIRDATLSLPFCLCCLSSSCPITPSPPLFGPRIYSGCLSKRRKYFLFHRGVVGRYERRYKSLPGQPPAHSRHSISGSYDYTEEVQRLLVGGFFVIGFLHHFLAVWLLPSYVTFICLHLFLCDLFLLS